MERTLGPRNVGDILKETFTIYGKNFWRFTAIISVAAVPSTIIGTIVDLLFPAHGEMAHRNAASFFIILPLYLLAFVLSILTAGTATHAIAEQYVKQPINFGRAFGFSWNRLSDMFWAVVLVILAVWGITAGAVMISLFIAIFGRMHELSSGLIFLAMTLVAIIAAVYLIVRWAFAIPTALLEGHGPTTALSSSSSLVKQNWWRVLGILLLLGLILVAIVLILLMPAIIGAIGAAIAGDITAANTELPTWALVWAIIATLIANIVCTPLFTIGQTLLYFDLRVRKQGYNLDALANELGLTSTVTDSTATPPI
jgi:hypothetical protein